MRRRRLTARPLEDASTPGPAAASGGHPVASTSGAHPVARPDSDAGRRRAKVEPHSQQGADEEPNEHEEPVYRRRNPQQQAWLLMGMISLAFVLILLAVYFLREHFSAAPALPAGSP